MTVGSWNYNISTVSMPPHIADAFDMLCDVVGAGYSFIAYLGSQIVSGVNYAVLAKQTILMSKNTKENIVVVIFYEDPQGNTAVTSIIPILEGYSEFGGFRVNVEYELNDKVKTLFNKHFDGFVETIATPIACLGNQIVRGTEYAILCEFSPVINCGSDDRDVKIVFINDIDEDFSMINIL